MDAAELEMLQRVENPVQSCRAHKELAAILCTI